MSTKKSKVCSSGWSDLWKKEDWWAVWLGLGLVLIAILFWSMGTSLKPLAVSVPEWSNFEEVRNHFSSSASNYLFLFLVLTLIFSLAIKIFGS